MSIDETTQQQLWELVYDLLPEGDAETLREFIAKAPLSAADRERLDELTASSYIGLAAELARRI